MSEHEISVLQAAGATVSPSLFAYWSKNQREEALVWADSILVDLPMERPAHLPNRNEYGSTRVTLASMKGHRIERIEVIEVRRHDWEFDPEVRLVCDTGVVAICLESDCCSTSYFADVKEFNALVGSRIHEVEERDLGEVPRFNDTRTLAHCLVFTTDKGHVTIDWRNDSNGYYDGSVEASVIELAAKGDAKE